MTISIIITAYNVSKYILKSIQSALLQNVNEVIVVEDCSIDNTLELIQNIKDDRLKIIKNDVNVGPGLSRRKGIESATSEYILLLDGDDYLEDNYITALSNRAEETNADIISSGIKILNEDGSWKAESYGNCTTLGNDKINRFWGERIVFMNNKLIRRSLYEKVPYNHRRYIEDTPTIIPILWYANKVEYIDNIGYVYVMRPESLTHNSNIIKDIIYKGLCWLDLMDFFNTNDKTVFDAIDIKGYIRNIITMFNSLQNIDLVTISPYKKDWDEFIIRLINLIKINNISFKS